METSSRILIQLIGGWKVFDTDTGMMQVVTSSISYGLKLDKFIDMLNPMKIMQVLKQDFISTGIAEKNGRKQCCKEGKQFTSIKRKYIRSFLIQALPSPLLL